MALLCCSISSSLYPRSNFVRASQSRERLPTSSSEYGVLLQSSIDTRSLEQGRKLHSQIKEAGFERNRDLLPKLVKLYSVCGRIEDAREMFERMGKRRLDVFVWTAMIAGYVKNGDPSEGIRLFVDLLRYGKEPDSYTFSALMKASADLGFRRLMMQLHSMIIKCGCMSYLSVANSLIYSYGSFGDIDAVWKVFDRIGLRDVVSWSSMIQACTRLESYADSIVMFCRMQHEECLKPNELTIVSLLPACGFFSSFRRGQAVHAYAIRNGFSENIIVGSSLLRMYSLCGEPDAAYVVFSRLEKKNIILWTSMIEGFSLNGKPGLALDLFQTMQKQGLKPNHITFVVILTACSHGGFVDTGLEIFETMWEKFGVKPEVEHYSCVVDMLARAGRLDDAERFIERMNIRPNGSILGCLLGACQVHHNVELGENLALTLFEIEPDNAANYVILSNIYASVGRWDDVGRMRQMMAARGLLKETGCSWIEIMDKVFVFGAHDKSHVESDKIYKKLEELGEQITKAGYVPSTKFVLLDVEAEDKKKLLCSHSERLAIAFGLLKAPLGVPIRIAKNLRVCGDCHDAIKLISSVTSRQFIIRDTSRFHHFSQGSCSCGDYW